jgi:hypothetical protein
MYLTVSHTRPFYAKGASSTTVLSQIAEVPNIGCPTATILTSTAAAQFANSSSLLATAGGGTVVNVVDGEFGPLITKKAWGRSMLISMLGHLSIDLIKTSTPWSPPLYGVTAE